MLIKEFLISCCGPWVFKTNEIEFYRRLEGSVVLDGNKMTSSGIFYDEIQKKFNFPDYFGRNYNALRDLFSDIGVTDWSKNNYVIVIENAGNVLRREPPEGLRGFLEILSDAGEELSQPIELGESWDRPGIPFHSILQVDVSDGRDEFSQIPTISSLQIF